MSLPVSVQKNLYELHRQSDHLVGFVGWDALFFSTVDKLGLVEDEDREI